VAIDEPSALDQWRIDRASPVPYYFQLASLLQEGISTGRWKPGSRLPSESDLSERLSISRTTVRQALSRLEQRGLIQRAKGQGTFVRRGESGLWLLQSSEGFFQDEVDRRRRTVRSQILGATRATLPSWACRALELPPLSQGATLERLRSVDGKVALYVVNYLAERIADAAIAIDNPHESLYRRLRERAGVVPYGGRRTLEVVGADPRLAELLEVKPDAPLAFIESVTWDARRQPFDCYRAWVRTDRLKFEIKTHNRSEKPDGA
jgi:GntR family transcriptional regulator